MAVTITINQAAKPAGVAGQAREDLALGAAVALTANGGPFAHYLWEIISLPVDVVGGTRATSALSAPTSASTNLSPIDVAGTYLVRVSVDSGSGTGALPEDVAEIDFYAGPTLNVDPTKLPRRPIAFQERATHNVPDAIDPAGNADGWARERQRWDAVFSAVAVTIISGRVALPGGGPATIVRASSQIASVTRSALGKCDVVFVDPMPDANYRPSAHALGATGGSCTVTDILTTGFTVWRGDPGGALVDADFGFSVDLVTV